MLVQDEASSGSVYDGSCAFGATSSASTYRMLYKLSGGADGATPNGLVFDKLKSMTMHQ